ncbi:hypothetical protein [Rossellomorea aquimaris]|uniref:hypothetical protein n=1 Tax=Rossellomorea aquimaris TaxID=189382 RepID=UPI000AF3FDB1|nr:hypothetical protein [Rossellomorea aquimaris]
MKSTKSLFPNGSLATIKETGETVTILKSQYVKNMKRYSYIVKEHPGTFFFEEELTRGE